MVFYIIAVHEEGKSEEDCRRKIDKEVLEEKGRRLGTVHHFSNEKVG